MSTTYHKTGEFSIPIYCPEDEIEFFDELDCELPGILCYLPLLGDAFWEHSFRLKFTVEAEGEKMRWGMHPEEGEPGWEVRGVQSVELRGRPDSLGKEYGDTIRIRLNPADSERMAVMYRDQVDDCRLDDFEE